VREQLISLFAHVVRACDPELTVRRAAHGMGLAASDTKRRRFGVAIGKAALGMVRGIGPVEDGVAIAPHDDGKPLPAGWRRFVSAHPFIDARSQAAFEIAARVVEDDAKPDDVLVALISGGASALVESARGEITFDELRTVTAALMAAGAPIAELNAVRSSLSACKAGGLVMNCAAPVYTLALSDVVDDDLAVIGSGPTCGAWLVEDQRDASPPPAPEVLYPPRPKDDAEEIDLPDAATYIQPGPRFRAVSQRFDVGRADATLRAKASEILARYAIDIPPSVRSVLDLPLASFEVVRDDRARVVGRMRAAAAHAALELPDAEFLQEPLVASVDACADALIARLDGEDAGIAFERTVATSSDDPVGALVAWGEPVLTLPAEHGEGGRAQQLALELAKRLRGTDRVALVVGTDGADGPAPANRPTPAGAYVDGTTWDAIVAAGVDPQAALDRRDAGSALAAVNALVVTGPTGINHADLVVLGDRSAFETL
jgi:hydroxypyruvate reductase